jgi:hypothetical protein
VSRFESSGFELTFKWFDFKRTVWKVKRGGSGSWAGELMDLEKAVGGFLNLKASRIAN